MIEDGGGTVDGPGLTEARARLRQEVDRLLSALEDEAARPVISETELVDFKEEAGRRGRNGELQPGETTNSAAAIQMADEVCCMANSPGGGALILGVEDKSWQVLGTSIDRDWLRRSIHEKVEIAPAIEDRSLRGQRVLVLYVAESREPVEDTGHRIRWRVGDSCAPVDRAEWWVQRQRRSGFDEMAQPSIHSVGDATAGALGLLRANVSADPQSTLPADLGSLDLLRAVGAIHDDGRLTRAAALLLTPANRTLITATVFDVHGGDVVNVVHPDSATSLLEQLDAIEKWIDAINGFIVLPGGLVENRERKVPSRAVREALLNGLIHRDWNSTEPTEIQWIDADSTLIVTSPGGFHGGVTANNVLTSRHARYPALADLFRAFRYVDKQGVGVDRMYTTMITLGHRPPSITQVPGPSVRCALVGGRPIVPIRSLVHSIRPEPRQSDVRVVVILDELLRRPFVDPDQIAGVLQTDREGAVLAIRAAASCTSGGEPLIARHKDVWLLGPVVFETMRRERRADPHAEYLWFATTNRDALRLVIDSWLSRSGEITSGDLVEITGISRQTAISALNELADTGLVQIGNGRTARYVRASAR